ncbi:succinate dehydrogenase [Roseovarius sp. A21]|uniref:Succinate dehydrogenase n=1 Tax=Roseovarius bejariae TaxID=2576383 RepID=A0A844CZW1_9RHOB|nr:succinate dehydrogenase [Roseovarius bejariae]MRU15163.1 succinate dehydrogenase [Roseovarius bejariae]
MTVTIKIASLICAAAILSGCATANGVADAVARDRAKTVVNGVVEERFPGVDARPVTDCIIDAASAGEIIEIAGASVTGVTQSTVEQVVEIAARPEAVNCIADNSLTLLGG